MNATGILLELKGVSKTFGGTRALHKVDMTVRRGEVHALIGENGAGKSTLMKVLSGAIRADEGTVVFKGEPVSIASPAEGRAMGIAMIYQELNLAPHLTVKENLTLGIERSVCGFVRSQDEAIGRALDQLGHSGLPLDVPVRSLSIGLQQVVEIARALVCDAEVIIMDEPTSSLSETDTQRLFAAIRRLRDGGISTIYISHFLEEVTAVADSYTVLRDGESVGTGTIAETDIAHLIELMIGRTLTEMFPRCEHELGEVLVSVEGLHGSPLPKGVSFELHRGEILGIAGLVGAGRSETLRSVFGLNRASAGTLRISGTKPIKLQYMGPGRALSLSLGFLSENRKDEGLATGMSIAANTTLSTLYRFATLNGWGLLNLRRENDAVRRRIDDLNIRCRGPNQLVESLSGGNQQKVALARMLEQNSDIVLLDEPTRGIDVGSKVEIYRLMGRLAARGKGIIFVSSYMPELLGICDSLAVMHRGRMSPIKPVAEWDEHEIMRVATSGT